MKKVLLTIVDFLLGPILFFRVLIWAKKLKYVPYKRLLFTLIATHYTLFGFGHKQKLYQAKMVALGFELDHYTDEVIPKDKNYEDKIKNVLGSSEYLDIAEDLFGSLGEEGNNLKAYLQKSIYSSYELNHSSIKTIEEYLADGYITILVPCNAQLVSIIANEETFDKDYIRLGAEIIRILNDRATQQKDLSEKGKNIYLLFDHLKVDSILKNKIAIFKKHKPQNKTELFLNRVVKLSLMFYSKKDFEL